MEVDTEFLAQFGKRLRKLREDKQLSQEAFAELCDLDRTYISGIERGKRNVSIGNAKIIADALGVSLSDFYQGL